MTIKSGESKVLGISRGFRRLSVAVGLIGLIILLVLFDVPEVMMTSDGTVVFLLCLVL
jgi:hypothetical protein